MYSRSERQIIIVKNVIFKDLIGNRIVLNRDAHIERPCLIISENNGKRYMLPISSSSKNEQYKRENMKIGNYDLINKSLRTKECFIKLNKIIIDDVFYKEPVDELDEITYYKCLKRMIRYYENLEYEIEDYEVIKSDIKKQMKKIKKKEKLTL